MRNNKESKPLHPPPDWGKDTLSEFLEIAFRNRFATFVKKGDWFQKLAELDRCFIIIETNWTNPGDDDIISSSLFVRCHSMYRAACEHALAGQTDAAYPQIRACLEYAAYALHIHKNPGLDEKWLIREESDVTKKSVKNEFTVKNIRDTIVASNQQAATVFDQLYNWAIDNGAHPNEMSVTGNLNLNKDGDRAVFKHIQLHGDGLALDSCLKTTAQTGVCALEILQEAFQARFELLGVRSQLLRLRKGL